MAKKYKLISHPPYLIDVDGNVYDENEIKADTFVDDFVKYVVINNENVDLARLVLNTFTAPIDLPIIFKDGDITNCKSNNLTYHLESNDIEPVENDRDSFKIRSLVFKRIFGFSRYFISSNGLVYDLNRHDFKKVFLGRDEYKRISLISDDFKEKKFYINRLVYSVHCEDIEEGNVVHHVDAYIWNNDVSNLKQCNISYNVSQEFMMGNRPLRCGLTIDQIEDVCKMMADGKMVDEIMEKYNIPKSETRNVDSLCSSIRRKLIYTNFEYDYTKFYEVAEERKYNMTRQKIKNVCDLLSEGNETSKVSRILYGDMGAKKNSQNCHKIRKLSKNLKYKNAFSDITKDYDMSKWKI